MPDPLPIRVIMADPIRAMVAGLGMHFADAGDLVLVGQTETASALWPLLATTPCDVLVVNAPALGGVELLEVLVRLYPRTVVLCTSVVSYRAPLMAVGARGYVTLDDTLDDLLAVIRTVGHGGWARSPLAEACWQWYVAHGDTLAPVQAQAALLRYGGKTG